MDPRKGSVAVIGAGISGLITAHTLVQDGFTDVRILTQDSEVGGVWASSRIYPGLRTNNVHGEYSVSPLEMPSPATDAVDTRLSGDKLCAYTMAFANKFLEGKIEFNVQVKEIRRTSEGRGWCIDIMHKETSRSETREYTRVVLCTGGCSTMKIPPSLAPAAAIASGFKGMVFHSMDFGAKMDELLRQVPPSRGDEPDTAPIVVIGGGKSAQDICAYLVNEGRKVAIVCPNFDSFTAASDPLPDFVRKSRMLSLFSPHIHLRTFLERFLHTTWLGAKVVDFMWKNLAESAFRAAGIPADSPLRNTVSPYWNPRTNDEGVPQPNGFHALAVAGKIDLVSPARVEQFGDDGRSVVLADGRSIEASAVVVAVGYTSSWSDFMNPRTLEELGLAPQPVTDANVYEWNYASLRNPPPLHPDAARWFLPIHRGIVPAKLIAAHDFALNGAVESTNFGYTIEVTAHWISSYFLGDTMRIPRTPEAALAETARAAAWLRARYPELPTALHGSKMSYFAFWTAPQHADDLLEDMGLRVIRSGGNWLTWPFQVVDPSEIRTLKEERDAKRAMMM